MVAADPVHQDLPAQDPPAQDPPAQDPLVQDPPVGVPEDPPQAAGYSEDLTTTTTLE